MFSTGADPEGGGGGWGSGPQPPFWGTPKRLKEGKNVACMWMNGPHFSTYITVMRTPLSEILYPPLPQYANTSWME